MFSKDVRDYSLSAIRRRYGIAVVRAATTPDSTTHDSLRDVPFLLKEIDTMTPRADEHGRVTIENELLKEQVEALAAQVKDLEDELVTMRYEERVINYNGC